MYACTVICNRNVSNVITWQAVIGIYVDSSVHESLSHRFSHCGQRNFCFLPVVLQIQIRTARFLQVFTATENSLCLLFYDNAAEQLFDMFREHNVRTANQFANAVYGEFTVVEQWFTMSLVKFITLHWLLIFFSFFCSLLVLPVGEIKMYILVVFVKHICRVPGNHCMQQAGINDSPTL